MSVFGSYTFEEQLRLVQSGLRGLKPKQAEDIARNCIEAREHGERCSVWHCAAEYFGTECQCAPCVADRNEKKGR